MTTDANSLIQDVLFDKTANMTPQTSNSAITFFDRDFTGVVASAHNSTGYGGVNYPVSDEPSCAGNGNTGGQNGFTMGGTCYANSGSQSVRPLPFFWRTDGYFDSYIVIQGARSYDGNARQWTSMDRYGGSPMDPMSEQPYVWDGNDPISNTDPTGMCSIPIIPPRSGADVEVAPCDLVQLGFSNGPTLGELIPTRDPVQIKLIPVPPWKNKFMLPDDLQQCFGQPDDATEAFGDATGDVVSQYAENAADNPGQFGPEGAPLVEKYSPTIRWGGQIAGALPWGQIIFTSGCTEGWNFVNGGFGGTTGPAM
jgi:hypothetical protein